MYQPKIDKQSEIILIHNIKKYCTEIEVVKIVWSEAGQVHGDLSTVQGGCCAKVQNNWIIIIVLVHWQDEESPVRQQQQQQPSTCSHSAIKS